MITLPVDSRLNRFRFFSIRTLLVSSLPTLLVFAGCSSELVGPSPSETQDVSAAKPIVRSLTGSAPQWVVNLEPGGKANEVAATYGLEVVQTQPQVDLALLEGVVDPQVLAADLRVRAVEANDETQLSETLNVLLGFHEGEWTEGLVEGQSSLASLQLNDVHAISRGAGVRVAILDTGLDVSHPAYQDNLELHSNPGLGPVNETRNNVDDDGDGLVDEGYGHGTHVSGLVVGVAPDATIIPIPILDDEGMGNSYTLVLGLLYALDRDVDVINLSMSLEGVSGVVELLLAELDAAGVVVCAAAGNTPGQVVYPGSSPYTLSAAATDQPTVLAAFSGSGSVDLAAPGVGLVSAFPKDALAVASGTSMSTAVLSGCVAVLLSQVADAGQAVSLLQTTAVPLTVGSILHGEVAPLAALQVSP